MNNILYERKEPRQKINWPELVFYASGSGENFQELTITTLKSEYNTLCQEEALKSVAFYGDEDVYYERIRERALWEMDNGDKWVREYIKVDEDFNVTACIDADSVTDAEVDIVLARLEETPMPGEKIFSEWKSFTSKQVQEILFHETADE